jgi:hypothetical protein
MWLPGWQEVGTQKQTVLVSETEPRVSLEFCVMPCAQARPGRYHHDMYQGEAPWLGRLPFVCPKSPRLRV